MVGFQKIQVLLVPGVRMTTAQVAAAVSLSVGHVRRVLRWMGIQQMVRLLPGSRPHLWSV
jgi:hypothetical protein